MSLSLRQNIFSSIATENLDNPDLHFKEDFQSGEIQRNLSLSQRRQSQLKILTFELSDVIFLCHVIYRIGLVRLANHIERSFHFL